MTAVDMVAKQLEEFVETARWAAQARSETWIHSADISGVYLQ